jgi:peptidyl-prolyl cis-trans isomerase C
MFKSAPWLLCWLPAASLPHPPSPKSKAYATARQGHPQTVYDAFLAEQRRSAPRIARTQERDQGELIRRELLSQEPPRRASTRSGSRVQMELARQAVLIRSFMGATCAAILSATPIVSRQRAIEEVARQHRVQGRHILVEKEDDQGDHRQAGQGENSRPGQAVDGPRFQGQGRRTRRSAPPAYVKPFGDTLTTLKKGEYTKTPVKTDYGFHASTRRQPPADAAAVRKGPKPQLQQRATQMQVKPFKDLRAKAKVY